MIEHKKVLCLGSNTLNTDTLIKEYTFKHNLINHGLITDPTIEIQDGFYHTSLADIHQDDIIPLTKKFDAVVILNQPRETYDNIELYVSTKNLIFLLNNRSNVYNGLERLDV